MLIKPINLFTIRRCCHQWQQPPCSITLHLITFTQKRWAYGWSKQADDTTYCQHPQKSSTTNIAKNTAKHLSNIPAPAQFTTVAADMTLFQQTESVCRCTMPDWLDQLSAATDWLFQNDGMCYCLPAYGIKATHATNTPSKTFSKCKPSKTTTALHHTAKHQCSTETTKCAYLFAQQCKEWTPPTSNLHCPKPWPEHSHASPSHAISENICLITSTTQVGTLQTTHHSHSTSIPTNH